MRYNIPCMLCVAFALVAVPFWLDGGWRAQEEWERVKYPPRRRQAEDTADDDDDDDAPRQYSMEEEVLHSFVHFLLGPGKALSGSSPPPPADDEDDDDDDNDDDEDDEVVVGWNEAKDGWQKKTKSRRRRRRRVKRMEGIGGMDISLMGAGEDALGEALGGV